MLRTLLTFTLFTTHLLSAQSTPWSTSVEVGWNSGGDLGYALRLNHSVAVAEQLNVVFSALVERAVVKTEMVAGDAYALSGGISETFLPSITAFELRSGVGGGLRRQFDKFSLGCSVRAVWRLNRALDINLPNRFATDGLPLTTRSIRYGEQFDRSPEIADDEDLVVSGDRLRLQAGLEAGIELNQHLELSFIYRYDTLNRNTQEITGLGGFRPDPEVPLNLFRGISRGHYLMAALTIGF